jgi:hypothetical protein
MTSAGTTAGQKNRAFDRAVETGDLHMALAVAADMGGVDLRRATPLLRLMATQRSPLYPRAAARWLARFATERKEVTPALLAQAAGALAELADDPDRPDAAIAELQRLCAARRIL